MKQWRLSYEKIRPMIRPGDVWAFHGMGPFSHGIAIYEYFKTKTPIQDCITHVAISVSGPSILERKLIIEADEGEVNSRSISQTIKGYNGRVYYYPLRHELNILRNSFDLCAWQLIGTKYDFGGVFNNLFGNVNINIRRFFCSELVQYVMRSIPNIIVCEILRNINKKAIDFPVLGLLHSKKAMRPHQLMQLPFFLPRIEIVGMR